MSEFKRSRATAYGNDDIKAMVKRLARGEITDWKVESLARAVHQATGWAGTPVAWDDEGLHWSEDGRQRGLAEAREVLEEALNE